MAEKEAIKEADANTSAVMAEDASHNTNSCFFQLVFNWLQLER